MPADGEGDLILMEDKASPLLLMLSEKLRHLWCLVCVPSSSYTEKQHFRVPGTTLNLLHEVTRPLLSVYILGNKPKPFESL